MERKKYSAIDDVCLDAVSTFAWYNASQVKATMTPTNSNNFTVSTGYTDQTGAKIVATITGDDTAVVVTNTSGESKYVLNGVALDSTGNKYGTGTISLAWATGDDAPTDQQKAAAIGSYTLTFTPSNYAKVGGSASDMYAAYHVSENARTAADKYELAVTVSKSGNNYVIAFTDGGTASHTFIYGVQAKYEATATNFDVASDHTADKIQATLA